MRPVVRYAGREKTSATRWKVSFDLIENAGTTRYWGEIRTGGLVDPLDVDTPNFWGYVAYAGGHFIEQRQLKSAHEIYSSADEAMDKATTARQPQAEPEVGAICWRFGSPPYDD